jgi:hypothetical protein
MEAKMIYHYLKPLRALNLIVSKQVVASAVGKQFSSGAAARTHTNMVATPYTSTARERV